MFGTGRHPPLGLLVTVCTLCGWVVPALSPAQYIYLDANGDGIHTAADLLAAQGTTTLDVWLRTDQDRDGSPAICAETGDPFEIFSYEFILHASAGTVEWGTYANGQPAWTYPFGPKSNSTDFGVGYGGSTRLPAGLYRLGTLAVRVLSGTPSISFAGSTPLDYGYLTCFGTTCLGSDYDGTNVFGIDWTDADGVAFGGVNRPPQLEQPLDMEVTEGGTAEQEITASDPDLSAVTFRKAAGPGYMAVSTPESWSGGGRGKIRLAPGYADAGESTGVVAATDGLLEDAKEFSIRVVDINLPPKVYIPWCLCAEQGQVHRFRATATDPDRDRVTWTAAGLPAYATLGDNGDNTATLRLAPAESELEAQVEAAITASDGHLAASASFLILVTAPEGCLHSCGGGFSSGGDGGGRRPAARAGGPYEGFTELPLRVDGGASSDPEGADLNYYWDFGDGERGLGVVATHEYAEGGVHTIILKVNDGYLSDSDTTAASIREPCPARTLSPNGHETVRLGSGKPSLCLRIEPLDGSFRTDDVEPATIEMRASGMGSVERIPAIAGKPAHSGDRDENGIPEIEACFRAEDLRLLFGSAPDGARVEARVEGGLTTGGRFRAIQELTVRTRGPKLRVLAYPNPMNPAAAIRFETGRPGFARLRLFDVHGRLVRVLLDERLIPAGEHAVSFTLESGDRIATGVYFYLLETEEGRSRGRVAVLK